MRICRTDDNQKEIMAVLRALGYSVFSTHTVGKGFPDLVIGKHGLNHLIEIKDGKKFKSNRSLTDKEKEFHSSWRGSVVILESRDDCFEFDAMMNEKIMLQDASISINR